MKTVMPRLTMIAATAAAAFLLTSSGHAGDEPKKESAKPTTPKTAPVTKPAASKIKAVKRVVVVGRYATPVTTNKVELTGSRIKRHVSRSGAITDGTSNVSIIDSTDIERSGATDLAGALRKAPRGSR